MATIETKLNSFVVPNFVTIQQSPGRRQDGIKELPSIPVSQLPSDTLRQLAQEWLTALYDKAGKPYDWRFE